MIIDLIISLVILDIVISIIFYVHELGHLGRRVNFKLKFPLPNAWSYDAQSRYGGLIVNVSIFALVWYFKPENFFVNLIGAVSWAHFILYSIFGSFNKEPRVPEWMLQYFVLDDIPNKYWWVFVPLALGALYYFQSYYIPIFIELFTKTWMVI